MFLARDADAEALDRLARENARRFVGHPRRPAFLSASADASAL